MRGMAPCFNISVLCPPQLSDRYEWNKLIINLNYILLKNRKKLCLYYIFRYKIKINLIRRTHC